MDRHLLRAAIAIAAALVLTACSDSSKKSPPETAAASEKKEPQGPPEPVTGQTAFYAMYKPARTWAPDLLPLTLASGDVSGIKSEEGKAPLWTAVFVSPSRREARTFTYSVVDQPPDIHKGVSAGGAQVWTGATPKSQPFQITQFIVNSDAAYQTAYEKAAAWAKKHPDKKPAFLLGNDSRFPAPVWYVMWGDRKSGFVAFVNATTGKAMTAK